MGKGARRLRLVFLRWLHQPRDPVLGLRCYLPWRFCDEGALLAECRIQ